VFLDRFPDVAPVTIAIPVAVVVKEYKKEISVERKLEIEGEHKAPVAKRRSVESTVVQEGEGPMGRVLERMEGNA